MKTKLGFLTVLLFAGIMTVNAQGGGQPRRTVEERVKMVMDKLTDFKLEKDIATQTDTIFTEYYRSLDKARDEMMNGQGDREKMREAFQKLNTDRDDKLKKIWSEANFKKFKDEIEPGLRPQRPNNGGGN